MRPQRRVLLEKIRGVVFKIYQIYDTSIRIDMVEYVVRAWSSDIYVGMVDIAMHSLHSNNALLVQLVAAAAHETVNYT